MATNRDKHHGATDAARYHGLDKKENNVTQSRKIKFIRTRDRKRERENAKRKESVSDESADDEDCE